MSSHLQLPDPPPQILDSALVRETTLHSLPLVARGKVRDIYAVGDDRLLMVASDRISAFDRILPGGLPGKGKVLTQMALFWFDQLAPIAPNHLTGQAPESVVAPDEVAQVEGRSMLVRRLTPIPAEAVVRGYLAGSGWKDYQRSGAICGVALPPGLRPGDRLAEPIFTPAVKAPLGEHDENCTFDEMAGRVGAEVAAQMRERSLQLYREGARIASRAGILMADTKFEFGLDAAGGIVLMDEVMTPDSSRYWRADGWAPGTVPDSLDKQPLRDWLAAPEYAAAVEAGRDLPSIPPDLARRLIAGYWDVYQRIRHAAESVRA